MGISNVEDIYELTPLQRGMLLHSVHDGAADMYLSQQTYRADGPLDPDALVRAWQAVVDAHPALRTSFHWEGLDKPLQVVHRAVTLPVHRHDWSDVDERQWDKRLEQVRADDSAAAFDLTAAPLQRLHLIRLGPDRHYLTWTFHHLLMDGWSVGIFLSDLLAHYRRLTAGGPPPPPSPPFRGHIAWLQRQDPEAARSFWVDLLAGVTPSRLSALKPDSPWGGTGAVDQRHTALAAPVAGGLREAAARHRVTVGTLIQAAWAVVLRRYTDTAEVTFGAVASGRPAELAGVDRIVGMFANTLPARITVPDGGDLGIWLRDVQHMFARTRRYEHTPLVDIKKWVGVSGRPLFDSTISLETYPSVVDGGDRLTFRQVTLHEKISHPVALTIAPETATVQLVTHRDRFEPGFVDEVGARLDATLEAMATAERIGAVASAAGPLAVPAPVRRAGPGTRDTAAATALEASIAAVYRDVLGLAEVDVTTSFFELGGDSFDAVRAAGRIDGASIGTLASHPSARELAAALAPGEPAAPAPPPLVPVPRDGEMPCTYQQEAVWFIHQVNPTTSYHIPVALRLRGDLDVPALGQALQALVARHEALRTRFVDRDGVPRQVIDPPPAAPSLPLVDLAADRVARWAEDQCSRPFDLAAGPVFRVAAAQIAPDEHILVLVAHHIVGDGWSATVVGRELSTLYAAAVDGRPADLPPLPVQPVDFAAWQRRWLTGAELDRQLGYWRDKLSGLSEVDFPSDRPRPARPTGAGAAVSRWLPRDTTDSARAYARTRQVSFLALLQAALLTVLHRYTGRLDLPVGSLFAGRTRPDIEALAGYFGNTVVLRTDLGGDPTFSGLVGRCHDTVTGATAHQDVPFQLVVGALRPRRVAGRNPLFQLTLTLHPAGITGADLSLGDVTVETVEVADRSAMFDIAIDVSDVADGPLGVAVEYSTELFDAGRMERFLDDFLTTLTGGVAAPETPVAALAARLDPVAPAPAARPVPAEEATAPAHPETEGRLAAIWRDLLGAERVGAADDFFDLGGTSLHVTRLVARVRATLGVRLEPHDVFALPTVGKLAARLDGLRAGAPPPAEPATIAAAGSRR